MPRTARRMRDETQVTFDFAPMVDIVLLLVIFFMLTSTFVQRDKALPLTLPRASSSVSSSTPLPSVSVDQQGVIYLDGDKVTLAQLEERLRPLARDSGGVVALRADERGQYGTVVSVIDAIKRAGGERLALGTRTP